MRKEFLILQYKSCLLVNEGMSINEIEKLLGYEYEEQKGKNESSIIRIYSFNNHFENGFYIMQFEEGKLKEVKKQKRV